MRICLVNGAPVGMSSIVAGILRPEHPNATILQIVSSASFLYAANSVVMMESVPMHQILDFILENDQLIVDVHCGSGYKFLDGLFEYKASVNEFFDRFVIPVKTALYYQDRTILTIETLIDLGVYPENICILFNTDQYRFNSLSLYKPSEKEIRNMFKKTIDIMNKLGINVNCSVILPQSDGYIRQMCAKSMKPISIDIIYGGTFTQKKDHECYLLPDGTNGNKLNKTARHSFMNTIIKINEYIYEPSIKNREKTTLINNLIKRGEKGNVDFKRELKLETKKEKANFLKDVSAIANFTTNIGYLIIGIDDDKNIIGIEFIDEEEIQQICYRYISPKINIECETINYNSKFIALITIMPDKKPFAISKDIDKLEQHDVFTRYGSTNQTASPREIIEMNEWSVSNDV